MLIPKNRHEYYLAVISGNDYPTFPPKPREEQYLAKLAGREVDVPTPRTPKERAYYNIINDIKFEPENRWQTFVAAANDDSITAPVPRTREEIWWSNITLSQKVIVEYVGTLPATLQTVEGHLESYKIYGNTAQAGTPTPDNPIEPSGCGERTENLFDYTAQDPVNGFLEGYRIVATSGYTYANADCNVSEYIQVSSETAYSCYGIRGIYKNDGIGFYDSNKTFLSGFATGTSSAKSTFTTPSDCTYIRATYLKQNTMQVMITLSEDYPEDPIEGFIPYGYKLPLTVNGVEYPIYLGEVETTRRVKKLVLTGGLLDGNTKATERGVIYVTPLKKLKSTPTAYCTHFKIFNSNYNMPNNSFTTIGGAGTSLWFKTDYTAVDDFKTYLAAQYANGTPVTVWYVLAEPETSIVNEPLMKIGDYTDTIDSTQTTTQIPTAAGETTISWAGEGLAPSEVELTYKTVKKTYISADDKVYQDPNGQLLGG